MSCVSVPSFCSLTGAFPGSSTWSYLWVSVTLHKMVSSYRLQAQRRRTEFGPHSSTRWSPRSVTHIFTHFLLYTWKNKSLLLLVLVFLNYMVKKNHSGMATSPNCHLKSLVKNKFFSSTIEDTIVQYKLKPET